MSGVFFFSISHLPQATHDIWRWQSTKTVSNSSDPKRRSISCFRSPTVKGSRIQNSTSPTSDANEQPSVVHLAGLGHIAPPQTHLARAGAGNSSGFDLTIHTLTLLFSGCSTCSSSRWTRGCPSAAAAAKEDVGPLLAEGRRSAWHAAPVEAVEALWCCRHAGARHRCRGCGNHSSGGVALTDACKRGPQVQILGSGCLLPVVGPTSLRGDAKGPSEDVFLGSTSAWTQNGLQVCLLHWSTFWLIKTLCAAHFVFGLRYASAVGVSLRGVRGWARKRGVAYMSSTCQVHAKTHSTLPCRHIWSRLGRRHNWT